MRSEIASPAKGMPLMANWAAAVTDAVNTVRAAGFAGSLVRDGGGAFGNAPGPVNGRDRRTTPDRGCYRITSKQRREIEGGTSTEIVHVFTNCYVLLGGILAERKVKTVIEDLYDKAGEIIESKEGETRRRLFLALRLFASPATDDEEATVEGYGDLAALVEAQKDATHHTIALYLLIVIETTGSDGSISRTHAIECDFRRGVFAQQWEVFA